MTEIDQIRFLKKVLYFLAITIMVLLYYVGKATNHEFEYGKAMGKLEVLEYVTQPALDTIGELDQ